MRARAVSDLTSPAAIHLSQAIGRAAAWQLNELYFLELLGAKRRRQITDAEAEELSRQVDDRLKAMPTPEQYRAVAARLPIEELELDARAYNVLTKSHRQIRFVGQLLELTEEDIIDLRNAGTKTLENVKVRLRDALGLTLKPGGAS